MLIISINVTVNCCNHKKEIYLLFFPIKSINLKLQPENQVQLQLAYHKILQRFSQKTSRLISKYCQLEHTITLLLKQTQHEYYEQSTCLCLPDLHINVFSQRLMVLLLTGL